MPTIPTANYDDNPELIEISSSEDEEEEPEVIEPEEDPSSPTARGTRMARLQAKLAQGMMTLRWMTMQRTWGVNHPRRRNAERKFEVSVIRLRR